jgi:uncharacterized protein
MKISVDLVLLLAAVALAGALLGAQLAQPQVIEIIKVKKVPAPAAFTTTMIVPAVDPAGRGIATNLTVEVKVGRGRIMTDIGQLLFWVDTQQSIRIAKAVAENVTGIDTANLDIIYAIETGNATIVGGPSAGAALAVATVSVLEARQLNNSVMITGTIEPDGSIGKVGMVAEKARAAKEVGATLFLVPPGQSTAIYLKPIERCIQKTGFVYCETTYEKVKVNIGKDIGIEVREVADITSALDFFFI